MEIQIFYNIYFKLNNFFQKRIILHYIFLLEISKKNYLEEFIKKCLLRSLSKVKHENVYYLWYKMM